MLSEIVGTAALWVALAAAIVIALTRRASADAMRATVVPALAVLLLQLAHFGEEFATEFYRLFPERLGLAPWSATFFVAFNLAWLVLWSLGIAAASTRRASLYAATVLWFLAIAAIGNGIAHPLLALSAGGYFPGLITAPFLGLAGLAVAWRLLSPAKVTVRAGQA